MSYLPVAVSWVLLLASQAGNELDVSLAVVGDFARQADTVSVKLDVEAKADTKIDLGLLTGTALQVVIDGKTLQAVEGGKKGQMQFKKGARLSLELPIDLGRILERSGKFGSDKPVKVEFLVRGTKKKAELTVVPGLQELAVDELDHAKTRVALVTNFGTMVVAFRPDKAPNTVANFIKLASKKFYDNTRFHRVIKDFMIQGGDPLTRDDNPLNDGTGGPGYQIDAEFNDIQHVRGVLSMARSSDPNSAGSQFFVMHGRAPHLDNKYTAFGSLVSGLDVLDRICDVPVTRQPSGEASRPTRDVRLIRAVVLGVAK